MVKILGTGSFQNNSNKQNYSFLTKAEDYISRFYPHSLKLDNNKPPQFILNAFAYTDTIIFLHIVCNNLKALQKRIASDIAKLNKIKYQSTHLYYFVEGPHNLLGNQNLNLGRQYSTTGYHVTLFDEKTIIEHLISSKNTINQINSKFIRSYYDYQGKSTEIQHNILEELISFVQVEDLDMSIVIPLDKKLFHLKPKITENFVNRNIKSVIDTYNALWVDKEAVDYFIRNNFHRYERQLKAILDKIRNTFKSLKLNRKSSVEFPVTDPLVFEKLASLFIPPDKKSDPRYFSTAKALVLYFFEYCDFGKKHKDDPLSLFSNPMGDNDSTNQI